MKSRLKTAFDLNPGDDYDVAGEPADVGSARALAEQDRYQFQYWAMSLLEALPRDQGGRRGADRGIDGPRRTTKKAIVQVKSGKVSSPLIRDLKGTVEREKAELGLFITLEEPTRDMRTEADQRRLLPLGDLAARLPQDADPHNSRAAGRAGLRHPAARVDVPASPARPPPRRPPNGHARHGVIPRPKGYD